MIGLSAPAASARARARDSTERFLPFVVAQEHAIRDVARFGFAPLGIVPVRPQTRAEKAVDPADVDELGRPVTDACLDRAEGRIMQVLPFRRIGEVRFQHLLLDLEMVPVLETAGSALNERRPQRVAGTARLRRIGQVADDHQGSGAVARGRRAEQVFPRDEPSFPPDVAIRLIGAALDTDLDDVLGGEPFERGPLDTDGGQVLPRS